MKQINKFATSSCIKTTECQNYDMIGVMTNSRLLIEEAMESKNRYVYRIRTIRKKGAQRAKKEMAIRLSDRGMELLEIAGILDEKEDTVKEWLKNSTVD